LLHGQADFMAIKKEGKKPFFKKYIQFLLASAAWLMIFIYQHLA
jgi:hypothetical protein